MHLDRAAVALATTSLLALGAPIAFVAPPEGLPTDPDVLSVVDRAPHPEAARLFFDWRFSRGTEGDGAANLALFAAH